VRNLLFCSVPEENILFCTGPEENILFCTGPEENIRFSSGPEQNTHDLKPLKFTFQPGRWSKGGAAFVNPMEIQIGI
jgi:hypothetical protein